MSIRQDNYLSIREREGQRETKHVLTFVAVPDSVKVDVVLVVGEKEEAEPRVEGVDRNDEEDPYDVALLPRWTVET